MNSMMISSRMKTIDDAEEEKEAPKTKEEK